MRPRMLRSPCWSTFLREPLTEALAPWCIEGAEASAGASELGLNLSLTPHPQEMQRHALLVSAVSSFEALLSLVIEQICEWTPTCSAPAS